MTPRPFKQVDVFTAEPYRGNPLAVVLDGSGLADDADAALRRLDQPVGDHFPAAAHASRRRLPRAHLHARAANCRSPAIRRWAAATRGCRPAASRAASYIVQECGVGPGEAPARRRPPGLRRAAAAQAAPLPSPTVWPSRARPRAEARSTSSPRSCCDNGPNWLGVLLRSAADRCWRSSPTARCATGRPGHRRRGLPRGKLRRGRLRRPTGARMPPSRCAPSPAPIGMTGRPGHRQPERRLAQWLIAAGHAARQLRRGARHRAGARRPRARRARRRRRGLGRRRHR